MSNRRRYNDSNRDRNVYQNSHVNYSQMNSSNWSCENLTNHTLPSNNSFNPSYSQNSVTFYSNDPGVYNGETSNSSNTSFYSSGAVGAQAPLYNMEISSEVWARAENSQLTPTAGEFIPSSYMYQTSNAQPTQDTQNKYSQRSYYNGTPKNDETPLKPFQPDDAVENNVSSTTYHQRRSSDRSRGRNTNNTNNRRQFNIEQSKAEGRKKLLQEAAGLALATNDSTTPRATSTRSNESVNRRSQVFPGKAYQNGCRTGDSKFSSKQQDSNHQQKYSSPRRSQSGTSPRRHNASHSNSKDSEDAVSQRERLTEQLNRGTLECLVCCEMVRQADHTWSCHNCYHVLHLRCIIKWANTSKAENGWRCPACQNVTALTPKDYLCFCNKMVGPDWNRSDTAHSCGDVCGRSKMLASEHYSCVHRCTLLCHPGPCPPCTALVTRQCGCRRSSSRVQCGQVAPLVCGVECGRPLSCGRHHCTQVCHLGACQPCQQFVKQVCRCGKERREMACDGSHSEEEQFDCGVACEGRLSCGVHPCDRSCHSPPCGACPRDPAAVTHCPCTKTLLTAAQKRLSCQDPVPTCGQICGHQLSCGQPSNPHQCQAICHEGPCPPCEQSTMVRCRCGFMDRELPCTELTTKADDARCQKKCTKKRMCGKHKCNQLCCIDMDHVCPLPCNHTLSCGRHRCEQLCHRGHCQPCLQSSFEELYCECGNSVLMPPVACGTKPPPCDQPCTRRHACDHEVLHNCHSFPNCPPCGILTAKYCYGKHELRKAVPCHMKEFSCGLPCGLALPCGRHKCVQPCHNGPCAVLCRQPCTQPRDLCGHPCNAPCHEGDCVESPCKESVVVTCECGHRSTSRPCFENNNEYQRIATSLLASKMADVQLGRSVDLSDMQGPRKITIKTLECTEECRVIERNRRLAIGLQIRNPDLSAKLTPRYSDFMRGWAKKDQRFCQLVHDKLTELVKLAKESKQKSRSYSFETMNRDKRQFVHEYCTHFGCESMAYDAEPKRNVVATAQRDKAWLPSYSLLEVVQREMGLRKVPLPNLNSTSQKTASHSSVLPVRMALSQTAKTAASVTSSNNATASNTATPDIDYFDYNG